MKPNEHANLLSIFFCVYAAMQTLMLLFIALYAGFIGYAGVMMALNDTKNAEGATGIMVVIFIVMVVLLLFGLTSIIMNIITGIGLRRGRSWVGFWGKVASILSLLSFMFGGLMLLPFGVAIGIYGLWFFLSVEGKQFLQNGNIQGFEMPTPPNNWQ